MTGTLHRRAFLKASGLGVAALAGLFPARARADYAPITYEYGAIPDDFGRREIVHQAMRLLHNRFRDVHVVQNVYNLARGGYNLTGEALPNAGLPAEEPHTSFLLWHQLTNLRQMHLEGKPFFPKVIFEAVWSQDDVTAWGQTNLVVVKYLGKTGANGEDGWTVSGDFRVRLNTRYLGGGGHYSDPLFWAMLIAHEMLHNLGHRHVNGNDLRDYSDRWQINRFARAVYCDGTYRTGTHVPGFV